MAHLCELLECELATAVGLLELLWHFTADFAPQGDIGRFTDQRIEAACGWNGESENERAKRLHLPRWNRQGVLIQALVGAGWLDRSDEHRLVVHDWHIHADNTVKNERSFLSFRER